MIDFTGGVTIQKATLHNENEVNRLNLTIGDQVTIERSGDVIPKVVGSPYPNFTALVSDTHQAFPRGQYKLPATCPVCSSPTVKEEGGVVVRCSGGRTCSAQVIERLRWLQTNLVNKCIRMFVVIIALGRRPISWDWATKR